MGKGLLPRLSHSAPGIIGAMEDLLDEAIALALCCMLLLWQPAEPFAVTAVLGSVALCCLRPAGAPPWVRAVALGAFLVAAVAWPLWALFLPVGAYLGLRERPWAARLAWAAALGAVLVRGLLPPATAAALCVLCAVAAALAVRESRTQAERTALRQRSDGLRERMLELAEERAVPPAAPGDALEGPADPSALDDLTERELAIAQLVARGLDNKDIAAELFLSEGTVRNAVSAVLQKKGLKSRTQLAVLYLGAPLG